MNRLAELLPFNAGETVASYCSRLAAACGYRHARSFGTDLGFRFQGLVVGDEADVGQFTSALGVSRSSLSPGVIVADNHINIVAGQRLTRFLMERYRLRFCPFCVRDDEHFLEGRRGFRAYGRIEWLVNSIRTCKVHGTRLTTPTAADARQFMHDFAANLAMVAPNLEKLMSEAEAMEADSLQSYVQARLRGGETGSAWLDTFPLYVAIRLCEIIGASERHGLRFRTRTISERDWSPCAGTGYDLLCGGEDSLRNWLTEKSVRFLVKNSDLGGRFLFGRLYESLAYETADTAYDPIREIMRDVALSNLPIGPGEDFFGPVTERRLHSVHSASRQFGIHPERLRKLLINAGLAPTKDLSRTYERVLIKAETMESFVLEVASSITGAEAAAHLRATEPQFKWLVKRRYIKPQGGDQTDLALSVTNRYSPVVLNDFLDRLRATVTCADDGSLVNMHQAIRTANCTFVEVIDLLLNKRLKRVAWEADCGGLAAIRLDASEIREATIGDDHGCIPLHRLVKLMPSSSKIVRALLEGGRIPTVMRRNPVKRNMQRFVEPHAFIAFMEEFVSLGSLATGSGTRTWNLKRELDNAGVTPVFIAAHMPFYRRPEILAYMLPE